MKYILNFEKLYNIIPNWEWIELKVGVEKLIISRQDIILYAIHVITDSINNFELVLALSIADQDEVDELLCKLCSKDEIQYEKIMDKWMFATIYYLYQYEKDNIFDAIANIYIEFGYPDQLKNLIGYMPCEDGKGMEERLIDYIINRKEKYI